MGSWGLPCTRAWVRRASWGLSKARSSPAPPTSILLFLLSSLAKDSSSSSVTLRLLQPVDSLWSAFWTASSVAGFPRPGDVATGFVLLTHLENKTQLQLSRFQGENFQMVNILSIKASLQRRLREEDGGSVRELTFWHVGPEKSSVLPL